MRPRARSDNERPLGRPAPGVRLIRGLNRTKKETDVTGGTAAIFHAGTAPRQRYQRLIRSLDPSRPELAMIVRQTCSRRLGTVTGSGCIQGCPHVRC